MDARPFKIRRIRYSVLIPLMLLHLGAFAALFNFNFEAFCISIILWQVSGILGITVGYHRLLAHQSFKTYPIITFIHAFFGALCFQQGPLSWVRLHKAHHAFSDQINDPHPQRYGFLFGHFGWPFIDLVGVGESGLRLKQPRDLKNLKSIVFLEKNFFLIGIISLFLIYYLGGLSYFLWAGCFRIVWTLHVTLFVNSICHRYGYTNFDTNDQSKNNIFVALLTGGEGWHNNHHMYQASPKLGHKWWELDMSWWWILFLSKIGLAWDLRLPNSLR